MTNVDPTVYLATEGHAGRSLSCLDERHKPALLVSYAYLRGWQEMSRTVCFRHWCMDSGAFTAWTKGKPVVLEDYIAVCRDLLQSDPRLREVIALDVIGSWQRSKRNVERMWAAGLPVIPVYHLGEPEDLWRGYAQDYPKVCLGGVYLLKGMEDKRRYVDRAFSLAWPCAVHALAVTDERVMLMAPFHSVDASSWRRGPSGFGTWRSYSGVRPTLRWRRLRARKVYDLRHEVAWYLRMEERMQHRWRPEMAEVAARLRRAGWRGYEGGDDGTTTDGTAVHDGPGQGRGPAPLA